MGVHVSAYGVGAGFCCIRLATIWAADCGVTGPAAAAADEVSVAGAFAEVTPADGVLADVAGREESITVAELMEGNTDDDSRFACDEVETALVTEL